MKIMILFWFLSSALILLGIVFIIAAKLSKKITIILSGILIILSYLVYYHYGNHTEIAGYYSVSTQKTLRQHAELRPMIRDLHKKIFHLKLQLEQNSSNAKLWQELATTYMLVYKVEQGVAAFRQAYNLDPNNRNLAITYIKALNMLAITAYKNHNYSLAKKTWQKLELELSNNKLLSSTELRTLQKLLQPLKDR